jgi:hypothetical protein
VHRMDNDRDAKQILRKLDAAFDKLNAGL